VTALRAVLLPALLAAQGFGDRLTANFEKEIAPVLGGPTTWAPDLLKDLRKDMTCDQVKAVLKKLRNCGPENRDWTFVKYSGKPVQSPVDELELRFRSQKLQTVVMRFTPYFGMQKQFAQALFTVAQRKWGDVTPEAAAKPPVIWSNGDGDHVTASFSTDHWELQVGLPSRHYGAIDPTPLDAATLAARLTELLGPAGAWEAAAWKDLKAGMTCDQARAAFPTLEACDPSRDWSFVRAPIQGDRLVEGYQLDFNRGALHAVTLRFHRFVPKDTLQAATAAALEAKWGRPRVGTGNLADHLTVSNPKRGVFATTSRSWDRDHWEVKQILPK
jgi:hypothetical protein